MEYTRKKIKREGEQCGVCQAKFEIWLNNSRLTEDRREKIFQHILEYCPVCTKAE